MSVLSLSWFLRAGQSWLAFSVCERLYSQHDKQQRLALEIESLPEEAPRLTKSTPVHATSLSLQLIPGFDAKPNTLPNKLEVQPSRRGRSIGGRGVGGMEQQEVVSGLGVTRALTQVTVGQERVGV